MIRWTVSGSSFWLVPLDLYKNKKKLPNLALKDLPLFKNGQKLQAEDGRWTTRLEGRWEIWDIQRFKYVLLDAAHDPVGHTVFSLNHHQSVRSFKSQLQSLKSLIILKIWNSFFSDKQMEFPGSPFLSLCPFISAWIKNSLNIYMGANFGLKKCPPNHPIIMVLWIRVSCGIRHGDS